MQTQERQGRAMLVAMLGLLLGCSAKPVEPTAGTQPASAAPAATAVAAPPATDAARTEPAGSGIGGGGLLQEQLGAIAIQQTLQESQAQSDAAARVSGAVAKDQLRSIQQHQAGEMQQVLDSMDE